MTVQSAHPISVARSACTAVLTTLLLGCATDGPDVPTHIGSDFVLGVWRDEDGVQQIRMYRLVKPSHGTP